uniref:PHD-type zinc finger plants domain-containing protein n=1 Tax=Leersia perrieri TaxID=77586 RepID=A0A0D9VHC0_9ORYZ
MLVDSWLFTPLPLPASSTRSIDPPMEFSASASASAAVCCMCGDNGLPRELFRCTHCRQRLQHSYCSDLYPRVAAYRRCNWCLREGARRGGSLAVKPVATKRRMSSAALEMSDSGCSRSAFCAEPEKPVKKPKAGDDSPLVLTPVVEERTTEEMKPQSSARKTRFRVKVRRYKLLTEVISC